MFRTEIRYDNGATETLVDSEPGLAPLLVGQRQYMPKAAQCESHGWYTVVAVEPVALAPTDDRELRRCPDCDVYTSNADHSCIEYDEGHPCLECGAPSVFAFVGAPGTGSGWTCRNGHYDGTCRELTLAEVQ